MIERYTRQAMGDLWDQIERFKSWLRVEFAAIQVRIDRGEIRDTEIPEDLLNRVKIKPKVIDRIEEKIKHDVIAFLMSVSPQLPKNLRPWLHHKMTSYDPQDTGLFMTLVASIDIIIDGVDKVMKILKNRAHEHKYTPMVGRTHGIHAEPITYGVKLANWYDEMRRHKRRLIALRENMAVGKLSGAVGLYTLDPEIEDAVCASLGLKPIIATQVISRDLITEYVGVMANIAGSLGKFSTTLRGLARTEIREVMEFFDKNQRGSSAMPHKKNPIGFENIVSLCRHIVSCFFTAAQNQITWDERDLANSGNERIFIPDVAILTDYVLSRFASTFEKMLVFPDQMMKNLNMTKGLIFSQDVQSLVAEKSKLPREKAYGLVREVVLKCWESGYELDFYTELTKDRRIMRHVTKEDLASKFDLNEKLKYVNAIFSRVFCENEAVAT